MAEGSGRTWLKLGCFGCLGGIGLVVLLAATLAAVAALRVKSEEVEDGAVTQEIPAVVESAGAVVEVPGRVVLDLAQGEFEIEPGSPGEPLRIEAVYDRRSHELVETFTPDEGQGWTYEVRFHPTTNMVINALREAFGGTRPRLQIFLPPDAPMRVELSLADGGSRVELGGLWLTSADIRMNKGGLELSVSDPLRAPIETLSIHATMCGLEGNSLGNMSPRELVAELSMSGAELDLRGEWVRDANVSIDSRMSGTVVRLPHDVRLEGLDEGGIGPIAEPEVPRPTVTFSITTDDRGDLRTVF